MEPIRVVVIDDHAGFRRSVTQYLEMHSQFVIAGEAPNAMEGLSLAVSARPDLVLLDIRMPGLNGLNIIDRLRQELPNVVVVVLTLWDTPEYRRAALGESRADAYLTKENMVLELLPTLQRLLPQQLASSSS